MISVDRVALPPQIEAQLKSAAAFVENVNDFAREDLIGFKRPLARTFAIAGPIGLAFVAHAFGWAQVIEWALAYAVVTAGGLYLVGRDLWPSIVVAYEKQSVKKRRAIADLNCGFGEASHLIHRRAPLCVEHDNGVLIFADVGQLHTLAFIVANDGVDPRWDFYVKGELNRKVWRWLRLPISRDVVRFTAQGTRTGGALQARRVPSPEVFAGIMAALDAPVDGAVLHMPLDDVIEAVDRRI